MRDLKRQMRVIRMQLEKRLGIVFANDDHILTWILTLSADVVSRYRRGADGKPIWNERRDANRLGMYVREARERINRKKQDWEPRFVEVRDAVHCARTGVVVGLTFPKRFPENMRWSTDGCLELRRLPWNTNMPDNLADEVAPALV